jgi:hypothetical protein
MGLNLDRFYQPLMVLKRTIHTSTVLVNDTAASSVLKMAKKFSMMEMLDWQCQRREMAYVSYAFLSAICGLTGTVGEEASRFSGECSVQLIKELARCHNGNSPESFQLQQVFIAGNYEICVGFQGSS